MIRKYFVKTTASDLAGTVVGIDFENDMDEAIAGTSNLVISIDGGVTDISYAFTLANIPNISDWSTNGDFAVAAFIDVNTANTSIDCAIEAHRVNAAGTIQESSGLGDFFELGVTGLVGCATPVTTWTSGVAGDRLRVDFHFDNTDGMMGQSVTIVLGGGTFVVVGPVELIGARAPQIGV